MEKKYFTFLVEGGMNGSDEEINNLKGVRHFNTIIDKKMEKTYDISEAPDAGREILNILKKNKVNYSLSLRIRLNNLLGSL